MTAGGLSLPGLAGNYASTPDVAALDIVGDIDLRAEVSMPLWTRTDGVETYFVAKWTTAGNNLSYAFGVNAAGKLLLNWTTSGAIGTGVFPRSTVAVPVAELPSPAGFRSARPAQPPTHLACRVVLDVDNGAGGNSVTFYTAPSLAGPWTQLGAVVTNGGVTSIASTAAIMEVGSSEVGTGNLLTAGSTVAAVEVRNGIDGTVVANPKFWQKATGVTSFADAAGRTWTVNSNTTGAPAKILHGTPAFGLPFQIAADSPCGAADSWCALRDAVAAGMQSNVDVISRTDPARPCAVLSMNVAVTMPALSPAAAMLPVVFDTIEFDNDRMIDFDRSKQFIRPTRPGIFEIVAWAELGAGVYNEEVNLSVMVGQSGPNVLGSGGHSSQTATDSYLVGGTPMYLRSTLLDLFDSEDVHDVRNFGYGVLIDGSTSTAVSLNRVRLGVYWKRDEL